MHLQNPNFTVDWRDGCDHAKIKYSVFNKFYEELTISKEISSIEKEDNKRGFIAVKFKKRVLTLTPWVLQTKLRGKTG